MAHKKMVGIHLPNILNRIHCCIRTWSRRPSGSEKWIALCLLLFLIPSFSLVGVLLRCQRPAVAARCLGSAGSSRGCGSTCFHESWKNRCNGKSTGGCFSVAGSVIHSALYNVNGIRELLESGSGSKVTIAGKQSRGRALG